jgi:hypothetical protein
MKSSHIFWGTIFLGLGILLLINNFYNVSLDFDLLWKIAPLILVFIGISIFIKNQYGKYILVFLSAAVLALTVFALVNNTSNLIKGDLNFTFDSEDEVILSDSSFYSYKPIDNINQAKLIFNGAAGRFRINSVTENLIDANTFSVKDMHFMKVETKDSVAHIEFGMRDENVKLGKNRKNHIDFSLNKNIIWDLNFDCGAASMNFDLEEFKVKSVDVDMGAADLKLKIGSKYPETKIFIDAGASSISLKIPASSGCELIADAVLSSKNFDGFKKIGSNKFRTENYDQSENKIFIELNCGVSSINIERY